MNIYVGNLSYEATENDVENLFSEYGQVDEAKVIRDRISEKSRGFAFVTMNSKEEANSAINNLSEQEFMGRKLVVNEARPRRDKKPRNNNRFNNNRNQR